MMKMLQEDLTKLLFQCGETTNKSAHTEGCWGNVGSALLLKAPYQWFCVFESINCKSCILYATDSHVPKVYHEGFYWFPSIGNNFTQALKYFCKILSSSLRIARIINHITSLWFYVSSYGWDLFEVHTLISRFLSFLECINKHGHVPSDTYHTAIWNPL